MVNALQQSVLISGASTGIGEDVAKLLASKGWLVFAGVRKEADADKLRETPGIRPVYLDVTNDKQIKEAMEIVRSGVGDNGLDVLINNAGLAYTGPLEFISFDHVLKQFDINVFGVVRLIQATMPLIRLGKPGRIINIGSVAEDQIGPFGGMYCATKAALTTISESLRREVTRWGIKVSLIKPGPVATNFESTVLTIHAEYMKDYAPGTPRYEFFGKDLEHLPKATEPFVRHMVKPRVVSNRIYQAITARNPKNVYYDTWGSYLTCMLLRWLPVSWVDTILGNIFFAKESR